MNCFRLFYIRIYTFTTLQKENGLQLEHQMDLRPVVHIKLVSHQLTGESCGYLVVNMQVQHSRSFTIIEILGFIIWLIINGKKLRKYKLFFAL